MEIMNKICIILSIICFLSCKKESSKIAINENVNVSNKIESHNYQKVSYEIRELINGINVFTFNDQKVTIQYTTSTFFGIEKNKKFDIFSLNYDLDLGEIELLRFDKPNSQVFVVELQDYNYFIYNLYLNENNNLYYLGSADADLSKFEIIKGKPILNISRKENNILLNVSHNNKSLLKSKFEIKQLLKPFNAYSNIQNYLGNTSKSNISTDKNIIKEYDNDHFSIKITEDENITVQSKNEQKIYSNNKILEGNINCPDTSLDEVVVKDNFFTIQKYNCNDKYFLKEYLTFKETDKGIFLHKYSLERTDKNNPDKIVTDKIYNAENFGTIKFENITKEFLIKLMQD